MPYTRSPCFSRLARQARILGDGRERQRITEKQGRVEAIDGRHLERVTTEGARQGHGERSRLELLFKWTGTLFAAQMGVDNFRWTKFAVPSYLRLFR